MRNLVLVLVYFWRKFIKVQTTQKDFLLVFDFYDTFSSQWGVFQPIGILSISQPAFSYWCFKKPWQSNTQLLCSHFFFSSSFILEELLRFLANLLPPNTFQDLSRYRQYQFFSKLPSVHHCVLTKSTRFNIRVMVFPLFYMRPFAAMSHSAFLSLLHFFLFFSFFNHCVTLKIDSRTCFNSHAPIVVLFKIFFLPSLLLFQSRARNSCVTSAMKPWSKGCVMEGRCAKMWRNF